MAIEYMVIYDTNYDKFIRNINSRLEEDWQLQGGVAHAQGLFVQALFKKKPAPIKEKPAGATVKKTRARRKRVSSQTSD